jgi:hypothetical protein
MSTHCWVTQQRLRNPLLNTSRPNTRYATIVEAVFSPCRAEPNRTVRCYTTDRDDVTRHHARFQGNAVVNTVM